MTRTGIATKCFLLAALLMPLLASCATTPAHDPFAGYFVGKQVRLMSEAVLYDCAYPKSTSKCLMPKADVNETVHGVQSYSNGVTFEVDQLRRFLDIDRYEYWIKVKEVPGDNMYWVTGYRKLFEKSQSK